jgi:hypothetical protein
MLKGKTRPPFSQEWKDKISRTRKERGLAKGKNNPRWMGGITKIQVAIRNLDKYNKWRRQVYKRDNYSCISCGTKGRGDNLNADHVVPLSVIIRYNNITTIDEATNCSEIWAINNGRTLCVDCHRKTDSYGWKVWNNYLNKENKEV